MEDFVVRRFDSLTFKLQYYDQDNWVNSLDNAESLNFDMAEQIKKYCEITQNDSMFELILKNDSSVIALTNELVKL